MEEAAFFPENQKSYPALVFLRLQLCSFYNWESSLSDSLWFLLGTKTNLLAEDVH